MKAKRLFIAVLVALSATFASSQSLWTTAEFKAPLGKNVKAYVEAENRTNDGLSGSKRWSAAAGADWKLCDWLKLSAGYTFIYQHTDAETTKKGNIVSAYWMPRHRLSLSLTGSYEWRRFTFSLRERYQYTYHTDKYVSKIDGDDGSAKDDEYIESKGKNVLRSRLQVDYSIRKCPITPFVSAEIYNNLSGFSTEKTRWTAGAEWKISKHHAVNLYYRYINHADDDEEDGHVIGVGYQFKL